MKQLVMTKKKKKKKKKKKTIKTTMNKNDEYISITYIFFYINPHELAYFSCLSLFLSLYPPQISIPILDIDFVPVMIFELLLLFIWLVDSYTLDVQKQDVTFFITGAIVVVKSNSVLRTINNDYSYKNSRYYIIT